MGVVGSKGAAGTYQRVIRWLPPHRLYVEPFAGSAAVFRHKRAARRSILIDRDRRALDAIGPVRRPDVEMIIGDGIEWLRRFTPPPAGAALLHYSPGGGRPITPPGHLVSIYCDPPYLRETRRNRSRAYYAHEWSEADHVRFLDVLDDLPPSVRVLVSGYWSELYSDRLRGWSFEAFTTTTRGGPARECLWANYPKPTRLHDYRYLGDDYRERERLRKHHARRIAILRDRTPEVERRAFLAALVDEFRVELAEILGVALDGLDEAARLEQADLDAAGPVLARLEELAGEVPTDAGGGAPWAAGAKTGPPTDAGGEAVPPALD